MAKKGSDLDIFALMHVLIELALLNDSPRAATVIAEGRLRCATLGKKGFNRLLGPVLDILKRSSINYVKVMQSASE